MGAVRNLLVLVFATSVVLSGCVSGPAPNDRFASEGIQPVLYIPFDGNFNTYGSRRLHAAVVGKVTFGEGVVGSAGEFDASGSRLVIQGTNSLGISDGLTMEAWVLVTDWKRDAISTVVQMGAMAHFSVRTGSREVYAGLASEQGGFHMILSNGGSVPTSGWHHIALTWSEARGTGVVYVDGAVQFEFPFAGKITPDREFPALMIGTWYERDQAFKGLIDEVRIYNVCLESEAIKAHATLPSTEPPSS